MCPSEEPHYRLDGMFDSIGGILDADGYNRLGA
jgi:hypothetical protein